MTIWHQVKSNSQAHVYASQSTYHSHVLIYCIPSSPSASRFIRIAIHAPDQLPRLTWQSDAIRFWAIVAFSGDTAGNFGPLADALLVCCRTFDYTVSAVKTADHERLSLRIHHPRSSHVHSYATIHVISSANYKWRFLAKIQPNSTTNKVTQDQDWLVQEILTWAWKERCRLPKAAELYPAVIWYCWTTCH